MIISKIKNKKLKIKKGEIATFLTLGLVVVGAVLTIATSILTNTKKNIASNPRAEDSEDNISINTITTSTQAPTRTPTSTRTPTPIPTRTPTPTVYNCVSGTAYQGIGCYDLCKKKGKKYIPNSQGIGTDGNNYCCCEDTEVSLGFDTCYKAYRRGMYGCASNENKVVIYAKSMSAVGMTSCSAYNKGSTTALYFANKLGVYEDGGCYEGVWDDQMDLSEKNKQAKLLMETPTPTSEEASGRTIKPETSSPLSEEASGRTIKPETSSPLSEEASGISSSPNGGNGGVNNSTGQSGGENVPFISTLDPSGECLPLTCPSGSKYFYKCTDTIIVQNKKICTEATYFINEGCPHGTSRDISTIDRYCSSGADVRRTFNVKFIYSKEIVVEPKDHYGSFVVYDENKTDENYSSEVFFKKIDLIKGDGFTDFSFETTSSKELSCNFFYNPKGPSMYRALPCRINPDHSIVFIEIK